MPSSVSCPDALAVTFRPHGIRDRTVNDTVVVDRNRQTHYPRRTWTAGNGIKLTPFDGTVLEQAGKYQEGEDQVDRNGDAQPLAAHYRLQHWRDRGLRRP